ncbi:MAG: TetR/AcrR family transcriptional regulator [Chloroflexi bacterium]|nr:TetR/AcrR family transcriptional regulator [Chloroflexota bacterium]OJV94180.1 MAG: hypothetical protein BGO39_11990 [Chloroflexi bacterium 54-19]
MPESTKEGLRERNKRQKFENIRRAAQELFKEKGFEATTTREIAERAGIGTGTLFLYARDKQDLLIMVYLESIEKIIEESFANLPPQKPLLDRLVAIFSHFLRFYALDQETARLYIQALTFQKGLEGQRLEAARQIARFQQKLTTYLEQARQQGEIGPDVDTEQASRNLFGLYFQALGGWLGGLTDLETTINHSLRNAFALQIRGLH